MAQTLTRILVHTVFSTKDRRNLITPAVEPDLHAYLGGICHHLESPALAIGGTENHVHLLIRLSKNIAVSDSVMALKKDSSKWIKSCAHRVARFYWQDGCGAFSIGQSQVAAVTNYIRRQKQRHKTMTFEQEIVAFAKRYGVTYDLQYLLA